MMFTLTIELGSAAMSEPRHVVAALQQVAQELNQSSSDYLQNDSNARIFATDGNTVGSWEIKGS